MHAQIHLIPFWGTETTAVTVQIPSANGLPATAIVGLAGDGMVGRAELAEALA